MWSVLCTTIVDRFSARQLGSDGVLALRLLAESTTPALADDVLRRLWEHYERRDREKRERSDTQEEAERQRNLL